MEGHDIVEALAEVPQAPRLRDDQHAGPLARVRRRGLRHRSIDAGMQAIERVSKQRRIDHLFRRDQDTVG